MELKPSTPTSLSLLCGLILFLFISLGASAQNVTLFTSKQGLVNSCIQTLYEDSRHNIWVGTRNGLNRYDGMKMNIYRPSSTKPKSLKYNSVTCIMEYDPRHILIGTNNGILSYDYATDGFTKVPFITTGGDTVNVHITRISRLSNGEVIACLAGYGSGSIRMEKDGSLAAYQITRYVTGQNNSSPSRIMEDRQHNVWIINSDYELYRYRSGRLSKMYISGRAVDMCVSSTGKFYVGSETAGLFVYRETTDSMEPVTSEPTDYTLWCIRQWTDGKLFICTDGNGLKVYDEKTGKITQSTIQTNDFNLTTANVKDALSDVYGNVWVGIYWRGVMMKPINQSTFEYVGRNSITKNTIGTSPVTAISPAADGRLWVATDHDGIYRITPDGISSQHWNHAATTAKIPYTLNTLLDDGHGTLWMGSYAGGLWTMNTTTGTFTHRNPEIGRVFNLSQDQSGRIWIATLGMGFFRYDPHTDKLIHYTNYNDNIKPASFIHPNNFVFCIMAKDDKIYVGTANGLEVYRQQQDGKLIPASSLLTTQNILCLKSDDKNHIWIGSTNGLHHLNTNTEQITSYTESNGLPNSVVNSIEPLGNNIWLATDNGLACFNRQTQSFETFYSEDGLQENEFSQRASTQSGGNLYFGGINGITYFHKDNISALKSPTDFNIYFVDFYINNTPVHMGDKSGSYNVLDGHIDEAHMVNLDYTDNHFSVELAAPGVYGHHVTYEYSFDGKNWTPHEGNTGRIIIQGLAPGLYKLRIRARTYQAMSAVRTLSITIHHPWYTSPLALLIYLLLTVLTVWAIYTLVHRQIVARRVLANHRREREINEARIQFFMNISHEIRTPMTLIMAPIEKLISIDHDETRQRNYRLIHQNAKRILRLVNQLMDLRKIEKGHYRLEYTNTEIISFIQGICDVFTSTAQKRNIDFKFRHSAPSLMVRTDTENLDKVLMNLLSNAFKFTPDGGSITLRLDVVRPKMYIRVTDTGCGISDADKPHVFERFFSVGQSKNYIGTGIGLNLTSLLVKLLQGSITVSDNPGGPGTVFTVVLPAPQPRTRLRIKTADDQSAPQSQDKNQSQDGTQTLEGQQPAEAVNAEPQHDTQTTYTQSATEQTVTDAAVDAAVDLPIEKLKGIKHRNVLIVEDDESIRQYLHSELSHDMVLTEFRDGAEAWDFIQKHTDKVDLVISDRMMPEMDGLTLCQNIKQNPLTNHLPVILITALGSDAERIEGLAGGADAYISKPFNIDVLRTTAINLLESRLMLQGKFMTEQKTEEKLEKRELVSPDEHLMERVMRVINKNMDNADLSVESFADQVGVSRVHFYRKIKELTGQSPRDFLKTIRLKEAARLLREKNLDITSVSDATGFKTLSTFSTSFKALYGMTPSEYQNANRT